MLRWCIVALLCLFGGAADANFRHGSSGSTQFAQAKLGAGGFSTGIDIAPDGTKAVRTDTYGAYVYNASATNPGNAGGTGAWQQVVNINLPAQAGLGFGGGVWEIAIAPSNTNHLYMVFNGDVFTSTNKGAAWSLTGFAQDTTADMNPNNACRFWGRFMAVDPANENIVVVGTQTHLYTTSNGGTSWSTISTATIPAPTPTYNAGTSTFNGAYEIVFDPTSAVTGGATQGIYVMAQGSGVYHSTGGIGGSWTLTSSGPVNSSRLAIGVDGVLWAVGAGTTCGNNPATTTNAWRFQSSAWSNLTASSGGHQFIAVAPDPNNAGHVYLIDETGGLNYTANNGTAFTGDFTWTSQTASDIPWLANGAGNLNTFMDPSEIRIDPSTGALWMASGAAVWMVASPPTTNTSFTWVSVSAGIEQLVTNWIISPWTSGSTPIALVSDKQEFAISTTSFPSAHGLAAPSANQIVASSAADWAKSSPCNITAMAGQFLTATEVSASSTDCGATWTKWANSPAGNYTTAFPGGSIAARTPTNWVIAPSDNSDVSYTTNGASSAWLTPTGLPSGSDGSYGFAFFLIRHIVCADFAANTFYILNNSPTSAIAGIYKSSNSGANWALQPATGGYIDGNQGNQNFNATLKCNPSTAADLWYTSGTVGSGGPNSTLALSPLYHSTNGGATWARVNSNLLVGTFGFGAPQIPGGTPTIYAYGTISGVGAIWRSVDLGVTWVSIGSQFPLGSFDLINTIEGDANTFGTVYIGFSGSGVIVGHL